jgi:hypothetical protein
MPLLKTQTQVEIQHKKQLKNEIKPPVSEYSPLQGLPSNIR